MPITQNSPVVKIAVVGVSRDCFPVQLTRARMSKLVKACGKTALPGGATVHPCKTVIESERNVAAALTEAAKAGCNAAVIYLGNFGPEGPLAIFAKKFHGPVMAVAAAEESGKDLVAGRGDALCGLLNASYNFGLRKLNVHIPAKPVGLPDELAEHIAHFAGVARVVLGVRGLKIFSFGPRPQDFFACNAPIKPLYDLGVEVMENSELDLLGLFQAVDAKDPAVGKIARAMAAELGKGNSYPDLLSKLARFELAIKRFVQANLGSRTFGVLANKCWPAFERAFGFVPCYVNSRLASQGMPVACEVDICGALSEYLCQLASDGPATLLDINNSVPADMITFDDNLKGAAEADLFMGFHCGNTPKACMKNCAMKYQLIMKRLMEDPKKPANITRGTLEGQIRPGPATFFRLQGTADSALASYIAQGEMLDIDPRSFGGIGVVGIPNFARFYRHVLIGQHFPHHSAVAFAHAGRTLFDAVKLLGVNDIATPLPPETMYPGENPFDAVEAFDTSDIPF